MTLLATARWAHSPSACPLALAPPVCACPLSAAPRAWARPLPAASQACLNPSRRLSLQPTRLTYASFGRPWVTPWAYTSPLPVTSWLRALPRRGIQGANASGLTAVTLSASLPPLMQAVPPAGASTAPATCSTLTRSYVLMPEGSALPVSAFSTTSASQKWSTSSGNTGESRGTNGPPPASSRSSARKSGGFKGLGNIWKFHSRVIQTIN